MLKTIYQKRIAFVSIFILIIILLQGWVFRKATFSMIDSDDEPELSKIETTLLSYKENADPKVITTKITVEEGDDDRLKSARVWISGNYQSQEDVLLFTDNYGITGIWNAETGILNLSGSSSISKYQSALRSIKYFNRSNDPSVLVRKVSFIVNDGSANSNIVSRQIAVTAVNDVPVLTNIETSPLGYTENDLTAYITGTLRVTDEDDLNLNSAVVRISVNYQSGQDILTFKNTSSITGVWNSETGILTLSGTSSIDNYQEALHSITYFNTSDNPSAVSRTISFRVNDGSENSATVTRQVTVTPVNDAPVANEVFLHGSMIIESTLTGSYIYYDAENDSEGASSFSWFRADDPEGINETVISGATAMTYVLAAADAGKYISFEVKPVASSGTTSGIAVRSARQHVIKLPPGWDVNPSNFTYKGLVTARVFKVEGIAVESGILAAFVGEECRGIIEAIYHPATDQYLFELICYSNKLSGDVLTFRYYDPVENKIYNMDRSVDFADGMNAGSAEIPVKMNTGIDFIKTFQEGWNWFSVNTFLDNMTLSFILSSDATYGDYIKSQTGSAAYYEGYGWFGSLKQLEPAQLYKIMVQNSGGINFTGRPVDISASHIPLVSGWNWIGYLPQAPLPVETALSSLTLVNLDYIKNQSESATYYEGFGWFGSLEIMYPGEGYLISLTNPGILTYPDPAKKADNFTLPQNNELQFNSNSYEFNGSLSAKIFIDGLPASSEKDLLYAWADNEIRGIAAGSYFEPQQTYIYTLMIFSNISQGENVRFTYFDAENNRFYYCNETIIFSNDMIVADALKPYELNFYSNSKKLDIPSGNEFLFNAYPNPFKKSLNIDYRLPDSDRVRITIYDPLGNPIRILQDMQQESGHYTIEWMPDSEPDGLYIIILQAGTRVMTRKVVLMP